MSGKTATPTGSALTDTEFFAPLVSAWQPQDDQSTHAAYTASDLMTAEGSATTGEDNTPPPLFHHEPSYGIGRHRDAEYR